MEPNEMVDLDVADDELPEEVVEENPSEEEEATIDSIDEPVEEPQAPKATEPGWIKKRVSDAVEKALAKERASIQAEYDAKYAPLMEKMLEMEAKELVASGKVKDLEVAKELLRYRQGQPVTEQPRNEKGQFSSIEQARTETRIAELKKQASKIRARGGPDVISEWQNNQEIHDKVIAGEMDFYDVAETMKSSKKRPPSPMRSPNGASITPRSIENMTDAQFKKLDQMLDEGVRFTIKR